MTTKINSETAQFDEIVEARIAKIRATLHREHYNFDVAAKTLGTIPPPALRESMVKHIVSVFDMIDTGRSSAPQIDEKIGDIINYLILLEGLLLRSEHNQRER